MQPVAGDQLVVADDEAGRLRTCKIIEVRTEYGPSSYLVRWEDTGKQGFLFPRSGELLVVPKPKKQLVGR
jgi:hypothetical protein